MNRGLICIDNAHTREEHELCQIVDLYPEFIFTYFQPKRFSCDLSIRIHTCRNVPVFKVNNMTNLECLLFAYDFNGGTIHQMESETGVNSLELLYGKPEFTHFGSDFISGSFAVSTCNVEFNKTVNFPKYKGNKDFFLGVIEGVRTMEKLDQIRPELSVRALKKSFK